MYVPAEDGSWVNEKHARIAELISEYDPNLRLCQIRKDMKQPGDAEFAVMERTREGQEVVAFLVQDETFLDHRLLAHIYSHDNKYQDVDAMSVAMNDAIRDIQKKEREDKQAEANDLAFSMLNSPLHTYRHNGKKIDL